MYLDDPYKKVSYSFRIEERLLNDIKLYSKATGKKLPETFNDLLKESIEGVTVDNTYLTGFKRQLITIPNTIDLAIKEGSINYNDVDLLNPDLEGLEFEVKQIPNNLDVWDNRKPILDMTKSPPSKITGRGYKSSKYPDLLHEGIELVLIPEFIKPYQILDPILNDGMSLYNCLMPIYYSIDMDNTLNIELINMKEALSKIKEVNNFDLLDEFTSLNLIVKEIIDNVILNLDIREEGQETYYFKGSNYTDKLSFASDVSQYLQSKLSDQVSTSNIVSSFEAGIERAKHLEEETQESIGEPKSNGIITKDSLIQGFLQQIHTLTLENEKLKEDKESIKLELEELKGVFSDVEEIKERLDSIEKMQKDNNKILGEDKKG